MSVQDEDLVDVEERLRDALAPFRSTRLPDGTPQAAVARGRRLRRGRRVASAVTPLVAAAVVVATALGVGLATGRDRAPTGPSVLGPGWHRAAPSPLSPRSSAFVLPLGDGRVLVLGGTAEDPCPPTASCVAPTKETPLPRDAAVYDPRTDAWRRVADPPVAVSFGVTAVVGDTAYVLTQPTQFGPDAVDLGERGLLAWSATDDRWTRLPAPQAQVAGLVALDDGRLLAYSFSRPADLPTARCAPRACGPYTLVFDPATSTWTDLPDDPLPGTSARKVLPVPGGAMLFAEEPVDGEPYPTWLMARWDAATNTWTRLPDPGLVDSSPGWFAVGGKLVNPSGETVDAGARGERRTGGIYDPSTGTWATVPLFDPADDAPLRSSTAGSGRVVARGGVLDVAARRWSDLPARPGDRFEYTATAITPDGLLVDFGGVRAEGPGAWSKAALSNDLWVLPLP